MQNKLILFYLGSHPDHRGRLLAEILQQDDVWLEVTHDYIQWLFPNKAFSRITPQVPVITQDVAAAFHQDDLLRNHLRASLNRMLTFYGLKPEPDRIVKAANWSERKYNWFTQDTHNNLRITRLLKCLSTLGLKDDALKLYSFLRASRNDPGCGIGDSAFAYWHEVFEAASQI